MEKNKIEEAAKYYEAIINPHLYECWLFGDGWFGFDYYLKGYNELSEAGKNSFQKPSEMKFRKKVNSITNFQPSPDLEGVEAVKPRKRVFYVDEIRKLINSYDREEISLSKLVEVLNEKATGLTAIELYRLDLEKQQPKAVEAK